MTERYKPNIEELEQAIEIYTKLADETKGMQPQERNTVTAAAVDLLPESIQPYAKRELAIQYLLAAEGHMQENQNAAANVYTALAIQYLQEAGVDLEKVIPAQEGENKQGYDISKLFEPHNGGK